MKDRLTLKYSRISKVIILTFATLLCVGLTIGCDDTQPTKPPTNNNQQNNNGQPSNDDNGKLTNYLDSLTFENGYVRPELDKLPEEIRNWVEYSKTIEVVQERMFDGKRFVLITDGQKNTGGYEITAQEVVTNEEQAEIKLKYTTPKPDDMVIQALTYPYELVIIENKDLPIVLTDIDNADRYYMGLVGLDIIDRPIIATGEWINLFSPEPDSQIQDSFKLTGIANVFEGTVDYELQSNTGEVLLNGYVQGVMGDWGYFEEEIKLPNNDKGNKDDKVSKDVANDLLLEVYSESAKDGSRINVIQIPLYVQR